MNGRRVTSVDHKPIANKVFAVHDDGFIRNDANADIEREASSSHRAVWVPACAGTSG